MSIKMIAIDIDGTLVNDQKEIGAKTRQKIMEARKKGLYVVLCTGRPLSGVERYLKELELVSEQDYAITFNGAKAQVTGNGKVVFENLLTKKQVVALDALSHELKIKGQIVMPDSHVYTTFRDISPYTVVDAFYTKMPLHYRTPAEIAELPAAAKYMWVDEPEIIQATLAALDEELLGEYYVVLSAPWFFEMMAPKANKGDAVIELGKHLGIKPAEIMVLGDENNDLTMFELAGFGVAMGNANEQIKQLAQAVTTDNNHDGVGEAIEKYVLK
ncbi:sugar-phosphatase [Ligilactobacillus apodemi]|uniref:HAD superfamily hydrolase n=1 Tax=Ligilactobacillus apodemi DSM 16634 = JCM 16172 TaxID=1423724 RepID=A0A0R1TVC8_9LACO|nr:sugar-phosphatase [Ligilactobacillus apodemi]KRL84750.1 HAD superfamily hydrolase [Ligilactobacillus apodemi DSM 16634 = JCM 16172]MCR1901154.1 sugar-phosphatase [Ligilactobacillus apodemi]